MKLRRVGIVVSWIALAISMPLAAVEQNAPPGPMAKFCAGCHQPMPGTMMGFLDTVSDKAKAFQMDFGDRKEILKYSDRTVLGNVASFEQLPQFRHKGFRVTYDEVDGDKLATEIVRFDIATTLSADEKLDKEQLKQAMQQEGVQIYDVRPAPLYQAAHIPGADSLPAPAFAKFAALLPEDRETPLILYGPGGCLSPTTALRVKAMGYSNVKIYTLGFGDWSRSEYTVTTPEWLDQAIAEPFAVVVVDVRPEADFISGHINGAVSLPVERFASAMTLFPEQKDAPIVLYGEGQEAAARQLLDWGYRSVRVLPISFAEWAESGHATATGRSSTEIVYRPRPRPGSIGVDELADLAKGPRDDILLVDLRNPDEISEPSIEHALKVPLDLLPETLRELPNERTPVFYCPTGARAEMAYNLAAQAGRTSRYVEVGVTIDRSGHVRVAAQ